MDIENKSEDFSEKISKKSLVAVNIIILVVFLLIIGGTYYWVSKKSKGEQVFPAGINYLSPKGNETKKPVLLYDFAKLAESSDWVSYKGKIYTYTFQHPKALAPLSVPNDVNDAVTFKVNELAPEQSLLFTVETISKRDPTLVGKPEKFASNYWKFFSGLKGLNSITDITNEKGLTGYKATYVVKGTNAITSDNYFFVVESNNDILLHIGDIFPTEGKAVLNRLINSLEYQK